MFPQDLQLWEQLPDLFDGDAAGSLGQDQVLGHGQVVKQPPPLGHHRDAKPVDLVRGHVGDIAPLQRDPPRGDVHRRHHRPQGGAFAHAVAAQQRDHLALAHFEVQPVQNLAAGVTRLQVLDLDQCLFRGGQGIGRGQRDGRGIFGGIAHIGLDHRMIARHVMRLAVGDQPALMQHRQPVRDFQHPVDVVFDQQHGMGLAQTVDQLAHHLTIRLGQTGQRLVQQQDLGVRRQSDGDFQQPLLAMRQVRALFAGTFHQPHDLQQRPGAGVDFLDIMRVAPQAVALGALALNRKADVLEHRQVAEHAEDLERARNTKPDPLVNRQAVDVLPLEHDLALIGPQQPGQHVEEGGLARAVRPNEAVHRAGHDIQVDLSRRHDRAEAFRDLAHRHDGLGHVHLRGLAVKRLDPDRARRDGVAHQRPVGFPQQLAHEPLDPLGRQQRHQDDNGGKDQPPVLGRGGKLVLQQDKGDGPPQRAKEVMHAAKDGHQQRIRRVLPVQVVGINAPDHQRQQPAGITHQHR